MMKRIIIFLIYQLFNDVHITGHENIVRLLIENGADINAVNADNDSVFILAITEGIHRNMYFFKKN